jgi:aryl-alcohol dehydrogenase-like predicted oxidoreductase
MKRYSPTLLSRRELLEAGLLAGVAMGASNATWAADTSKLPLITKPIPSTGERLPVIGLGTIWYRDAQYEQLKAVLKRLSESDSTLIDTAASYGESEGVVGRALSELKARNKMFIATKFDSGRAPGGGAAGMGAGGGSPLPPPPEGISRVERDGVGGQASFERSLQRLQTDHVDLLQIHSLNGTDELMPMLLDWKKAKKIRYIGVTTSSPNQHPQVVETMKKYSLDFVQVDYSIGNRIAEESVLATALERKVAVIANLPFGRAVQLQKLAQRPLPSWAADIDVHSWSQFLLKYVVSHPAVTCAIPGTTKVNHLEENLIAGHGRLPDAAMRKRMEAVWEV